MSTSANNPVTRHVLKYKGSGTVQVFQNLPTMLNGPKDGSDVGVGAPRAPVPAGQPGLEAPVAGVFSANRNIEFLDDHYCLTADNSPNNGVFKKSQGGAGQWGRVQGGTEWPATDGKVSGLHIIHPNGVPTLAYLQSTTASSLVLYSTEDGITGPRWSTVATNIDTSFAPATTGQSLVFRNSIVWVHTHHAAAGGTGAITQYDLENTTLTRHDVSGPMISTQLGCNYSLHVHDNVLFLFGFDASATRFARVMRLQSGTFQTVWTSTTQNIFGFEATTTGHAGMFTDPITGNLIVFVHGVNLATTSDIQVVSIANATAVPIVTDITDTVLGPGPNPTSGDGAEKYKAGVGPNNVNNRRWSVFVESDADPLNPRTFLTTWAPALSGGNGFTETWEWQGINADLNPVETGTGGQQGISDDFARPYVTATGGERSPRTGSVELEGLPERAVGGTKFEFRGRREANGTVAFYGDEGAGASTPSVQLPIVAGSLVVGAGMLTSLEAYYHFDSNANDSSGSGLNLTTTGSVPFTGIGVFGNAADFPGVDVNYFSRNAVDDPALDIGVSLAPFAVQAWVEADVLTGGAGGFRQIVGKSNDSNDGWILGVTSSGGVTWRQSNVGVATSAIDTIIVGTGGLRHIIVTSDGATTKIYVDAVEVASASSLAVSNSGQNLIIGNRGASGAAWDGTIDEVAIWSRHLTLAEIAALYNAGSGKILTDITALPTAPTISGNTIVDFTCDDGATLYSVILDAANAGIVPGAPGIIMADLV